VLSKVFGTIFFLSLLGILLVVFQGGAASTGQVIFSQDYRTPGSSQVLSFTDPSTLKVFQSNLQTGRPDYYAFQGAKDTIITLKLDTLRLVGQDNFSPSLALFGPGLPPLTPDEQSLFPYSLPAGYGLLLSAESAPISQTELPTRFDEPWSQSGYWERQSILNQLPEDGTYYLAVYNLRGQSGKYALFVGDKPEAGWRETLTFPVTWARLHYWFEDLWWPTFALVLVGLALVALLYRGVKSLGRGVFRPMFYARRNKRRAALLNKKKHNGWQVRRINRAPSPQHVSSNVIISRLLTQTAERPPADPGPVSGAETIPSNGKSSEPLPGPVTSLIGWEVPEKVPVKPGPEVATLNGTGTENKPTSQNHGDGLSEWSKRFRP
jgi:hypothetical protein